MTGSAYKIGDFVVISDEEIETQFEIMGVHGGLVKLRDTFSTATSTRKVSELTELVLTGVALLVQANTVERELLEPFARDFGSYSDKQKAEARRRLKYIKALWGDKVDIKETRDSIIQRISEELEDRPPSLRQVQRWNERYIKSGRSIKGLIQRDSAKGNRKAKVDPKVEDYISRAIEDFKKDTNPSFSTSYRFIKTHINYDNSTIPESEKLDVLSLTSFIKRLEKECPEQVMKCRLGIEETRKHYKQNKPVREVALILQRVEIDHTQLDLFLVDEENGAVLGRPTISAILDYKSKSILGFYIGFEPPSYLSAAYALHHAISSKSYVKDLYPDVINDWLCFGKPAVLVTDRGKEFESGALKDACDDLDITLQWNPGKHPWYKGSIESYFKSLNQKLLSGQPGSVLSKVLAKIVDYDPVKQAVISFKSFLNIFHIWAIDVYQCDKVSSGTIIPNRSWKEDLDKVPLEPVDPNRLKLALSESFSAALTKTGITKDYIVYDSKELTKYRARYGFGKVTIKRDRQDIGSISVLDKQSNKYFVVEAVYQRYAKGLTLYQHKIHKKFVKDILNAEINEEQLAIARMKIIEIVHRDFEQNKKNKILNKSRAARYVDVGQKGDGSAITSVINETADKLSGIPKPEKQSSLNNDEYLNDMGLPSTDFDGEDKFPGKLDF
jgi:putative transposase